MACIPKYVEDLDISQEDKEKLAKLHEEIFKKAHDSKVFRLEDGKLYTFKHKFGDATAFVARLREEYKAPVVKIVKEGVLKNKLAINVEDLKPGVQEELFKELPKEDIKQEPKKEISPKEQKILDEINQYSDSNPKITEIYKDSMRISEKEVNDTIQNCL